MKYEKPEVKMFKFDIEDVVTRSFPVTTTTTLSPETTTSSPLLDNITEREWL